MGAVVVVKAVLYGGESLTTVLQRQLPHLTESERPLAQELSYGVLRFWPRLVLVIDRLLQKPLKAKDSDIKILLALGLYQLQQLSLPDYAVLSETVKVTNQLKKPWAKGVVNALLRRWQRESTALTAALQAEPAWCYAHPKWWLEQLQRQWPKRWREIVEGNNQRPPMTLRVNQQRQSRQAYQAQLQQVGVLSEPLLPAHALCLSQPVAVEQLPGFESGSCSVQDGAAQLAAELLAPQPYERILDACAAPGGKSAHLMELEPTLELLALDSETERCRRIEQTLSRLAFQAKVVVADAANPDSWWDGRYFDAILLDLPCSASGVIRRHPDIKYLRRESDIAVLVARQRAILTAVWPLLKPGGRLLYATCSLFKQENEENIHWWLSQQRDCQSKNVAVAWGEQIGHGRQIFPGEYGMDGFYYALLLKQAL
ncbi:16S rRNA (cytosine(967)-C(5))-methyltransferase RsmB [Ectothiorhodospiraceae bacterium BW-2]|nr:16S rRNA (cytosine(967)-C(5))-methyltransferase RsmB [Ectothiorhodospiraceae bacterium BW-2]